MADLHVTLTATPSGGSLTQYALQVEELVVNIRRSPLQAAMPGADPVQVDMGFSDPSVTIRGILPNNAGSFSWKSMNDSKLEDFREVIDVNLTGSFLGLKYGTEAIRKHGKGGSIVMISSVLGKVGASNTTAVCAAKGGVRLLAKAGACELGPEKIRVNSIHPGLTDTEIGKAFTQGLNEDEFVQSNIPLGRKANSGEIAKTILFLVSDESFFMTGAELTVDGGLTAR